MIWFYQAAYKASVLFMDTLINWRIKNMFAIMYKLISKIDNDFMTAAILDLMT